MYILIIEREREKWNGSWVICHYSTILLEVMEHVKNGGHGPGLDGTAVDALCPVFVGELWESLPRGVLEGLGVGAEDTVDHGEIVRDFDAISVGKLEPCSQEVAHHP